MKVIFKDNTIEFVDYPFKCASVYPNKTVNAANLTYIYYNLGILAVRLGNELLFISRQSEGELEEFCKRNNINKVDAHNVWADILEPFVDTEFTEKMKLRCYEKLIKSGISIMECDELRHELSARMISYNIYSGLWDWYHLGHYDLLLASCGILSGPKFKLSDEEFEKFYLKTMKIALKGIY